MKRYFDLNEGAKKAENYDPIMRRSGIEPEFSFFADGAKGKKDEPTRVSKLEEDLPKNGKFFIQKKRSSSKSPFSKNKHYDSSNEKKKDERFNAKLKSTIMDRFHKDLEEENKFLKHMMKEINDILNEENGDKKVNGEELYKSKLGKIEALVKSIDEDVPKEKKIEIKKKII